jgi:hypothetical protein
VLARTHSWLTGAKVATLSGRSYAQVRAVLHRLVDAGVVDVEQHGNAFSYRCNREHVLAAAVEALAGAVTRAEQRIGDEVARWNTSPHALVLFGSYARRDGGAESDLDLLLVRPDDVDEDHAAWRGQRHELARSAERCTGNRTQIVELSAAELAHAVAVEDRLVASLRQDGHALAGPALEELLGAAGAATR